MTDVTRVVGAPMTTTRPTKIYSYVGGLPITEVPENYELGIVSSYINRNGKIYWVFDKMDNKNNAILQQYNKDAFFVEHITDSLYVNPDDLYTPPVIPLTPTEQAIEMLKTGAKYIAGIYVGLQVFKIILNRKTK